MEYQIAFCLWVFKGSDFSGAWRKSFLSLCRQCAEHPRSSCSLCRCGSVSAAVWPSSEDWASDSRRYISGLITATVTKQLQRSQPSGSRGGFTVWPAAFGSCDGCSSGPADPLTYNPPTKPSGYCCSCIITAGLQASPLSQLNYKTTNLFSFYAWQLCNPFVLNDGANTANSSSSCHALQILSHCLIPWWLVSVEGRQTAVPRPSRHN